MLLHKQPRPGQEWEDPRGSKTNIVDLPTDYIQTDRQRQTETDRDRHRQTQTDTDRHRQTQRDTERHRETQRDTERHRGHMYKYIYIQYNSV